MQSLPLEEVAANCGGDPLSCSVVAPRQAKQAEPVWRIGLPFLAVGVLIYSAGLWLILMEEQTDQQALLLGPAFVLLVATTAMLWLGLARVSERCAPKASPEASAADAENS